MNVSKWLGNKSQQKEKLVRIIVAKLTHDWKSLKKFNQASSKKALAYFANTMDIWQYTFPKKLDTLLQDIGKVDSRDIYPSEKFEMYMEERTNIENEFSVICDLMSLGSEKMNGSVDKNDLINIWLIASVTKALKDQTGLTEMFSRLAQKT